MTVFAFIPGILELLMLPLGVLLFFAAFVYPAIRRLQQKLGPDAKPTIWTYINELGGYLVVGLIILIIVVVRILAVLFG